MIEVKNIVKDYGHFRAVDNVSFKISRGEVLGFLGPNGAGKSTTMKMITGFLAPTTGAAYIGGKNVKDDPITAKSLLGYLPEQGPLYQEMTVAEFLQFSARLHGMRKGRVNAAVEQVISMCHLEDVLHQPIETLSKGFRQRVGLAQAIVHDPSCLVLDEPTDGLDPNQKHEVRQLISSMADRKAVILSTHILEEVEAMCTRVIIIDQGKIIADKKASQLREMHPLFNAVEVKVHKNTVAVAKESIGKLGNVKTVTVKGNALCVVPKDAQDLRKDILDLVKKQQWEVYAVESASTRLDEVFREITRKNLS